MLDGQQIGFVLWRLGGEPNAEIFEMRSSESQLSLEPELELVGRFQELGPFPVSADSVTDLLRFLRALSRRPLEAAALAEEFGPQADTAREVVRALDATLKAPASTRTTTVYTEWLRLFGAIYGDKSKVTRAASKARVNVWRRGRRRRPHALRGAHDFALIMKILATELVALQSGAVIDPLVAGLSHLDDTAFEHRLRELESGAAFRARGIENFLEGDFLGWYVDEWTPELRAAIRDLRGGSETTNPAPPASDRS